MEYGNYERPVALPFVPPIDEGVYRGTGCSVHAGSSYIVPV